MISATRLPTVSVLALIGLVCSSASLDGASTCGPINIFASNNTPVPIPDSANPPATSTINVAGAGSFLFDVNVTTVIAHTFNTDLDITLTSPAGTIVTFTTDNGGAFDNGFNGTYWNDVADTLNPPGPVTENAFANNVPETPLVPEEAMGAFVGENPNGVWTLTIDDDAPGDTGTLNNWSLELTSFAAAPATGEVSFPSTDIPKAIADLATVTSTLAVAGAPAFLLDVDVETSITHTANTDLDITLTTPAGRTITLTTDNGGLNANGFNGTLWDDDGGDTNPPGPVTENVFATNVVETPLVPEEALGAAIATDPNGSWMLSITDDATVDTGSLNSWTLHLTTIPCGAEDTIGIRDASNNFFLRNANSNGSANLVFTFGLSTDLPLAGDWNGDGIDTIGVYRPSTGQFFLRNSNSSGPPDVSFTFGGSGGGIVPLTGDWDGDGDDTIGLYIQASGVFFLRNANSNGPADLTFTYGGFDLNNRPVIGDWNGDRIDTIGLYVQNTGVFFLRNTNSNGPADLTFTYGGPDPNYRALIGDWDRDEVDTVGLFSVANGNVFLRNANSNGPAHLTFQFGAGGSVTPLTSDWDNQP